MKNQLEKQAGLSMIIGSFLGVITMILHPSGGDIEHLIKISNVIAASHTIALFSIPFIMFGFWGLSKRIGLDNSLSVIALITGGIGLFAVMIAAAINGLAIPFFVDGLKGADQQTTENARLILSYGFSLNKSFDYIFIGAICEAFLMWSIVILKNRIFSKWVAILGIVLGLGFLIALVSGFVLVDLHGFRLFIFGIMAWIAAVGMMMQKNRT